MGFVGFSKCANVMQEVYLLGSELRLMSCKLSSPDDWKESDRQ